MAKHDELVGWGWASSQYGKNIFINYKLSTNDVDELFTLQGGKCPGCKQDLAHPFVKELKLGLQPQIDHKHCFDAQGKALPCERADVRGLLCAKCNSWMGKLSDDAERIKGLLKHLEEPTAPWFLKRLT
jgi:hypothetical protein